MTKSNVQNREFILVLERESIMSVRRGSKILEEQEAEGSHVNHNHNHEAEIGNWKQGEAI